MTNSEVLPSLFKQIRRRINEISADGTYDTVRVKRTIPIIFQKKLIFKNRIIYII
ncbi:hypothetical protein BTN50_1623 (plasmid) [Candidatus Enterovibrio altilux]|uniref:Mobile element protein n=1 Tax=Candidatus Enterovibrio altilux TaxID=1927128 RepID=A0A291BAQ3_9GAMM|nr:hypothetical protein BTN50_1623 [Candidatus Enterovibrio luxaltus]